MAEVENGDYDLKDEELVDFEGSDYGFGSEEELDIEDGIGHPNSMEKETLSLDQPVGVLREGKGQETPATETTKGRRQAAKGEGAESGEIEEERDENDEGVVAQPVPISTANRDFTKIERRVGESRRKHRKADLEDGELDDAAMPDGSDHEAEGNADEDDDDEKENDRRERKRRKDRFAPERHVEDLERKEREPAAATSTTVPVAVGAGARHRGRGSEKSVDRSSLSKAPTGAGRGMMQMSEFGRPTNMTPSIMGPGRPLIPLDLAAQLPLRPMGRGFLGHIGGISAPGRANIHLQEAMAVQEHMLRSHRMMQQLVHANNQGPGRPPIAVPGVAHSMRPMMSIDFGGQGRGLMHLQPQELPAQLNFVGPVDTYARSTRGAYGSAGRGLGIAGGMYSQLPDQMGSSPRSMGRQGTWTAVSLPNPDVGRGRSQSRGQITGPMWGDCQGMVMQPAVGAGQVGIGQSVGMVQGVNIAQTIVPSMLGVAPNKMRQGPQGTSMQGNQAQRDNLPSIKRNDGRPETDGTWRIDDWNIRNGRAQNARSESTNWPANSSGSGSKRERDNGRDRNQGSNSSTPAMGNSSGPQENGATVSFSSASNLIQLGGPVQKSRVLSVSGLPENTSMSAVVEAFEKQGKVTDFRKEDRGDAFTITFASVSEAISAKRHLHRSILAGRQITVEYAVHRPEVKM